MDKNATVMITGAAGFIGSQLAHRLWREGHRLVLVDNFSYGSKDNLLFDDHDFNQDVVTMDIRNRDGILGMVREHAPAIIYNIAGIAPLPDCQLNPQEAVSVNVEGLLNLLEAARLCGVGRLVQASTNAMYENEAAFPTAEGHFALPTLIYPNTKYAAERFCESYAATYGMAVTCLRFANVYGPHIDCLRKQPPFVGYMIRELHYRRRPTFHSTGNQRRDYIYVDDLVEMALLAWENQGFDCVNVSSGQNHSVNEMYAIAQAIMGTSIPADYAGTGAYWRKYPGLYEGEYPIRAGILEHEVNKTSLCDNTHAKEKYGWSPKVGMEEGLRRTIAYETALLEKLNASLAGEV